MRFIAVLLLTFAVGKPALAQEPAPSDKVVTETATHDQPASSSTGRIGVDDVIGITVYDSPELTRNVRVDPDGNIRLPMVRRRILADGLLPAELEAAITKALTEENVLVEPVVTVSVVEYHSRPITVAGAVRTPLTFQATGTVTLLEAISRAGGISETAGPEILVTHPASTVAGVSATLTERIPIRALYGKDDTASNVVLEAGDNVRVPEAGKVYVVGNVKKPGIFPLTDGSQSSVLQAVALSQGLDNYSGHTAYIYRADGPGGHRIEIPVEVKKIMARKSPDVPLYANDMLYVPNSSGQRISARAVELALGTGLGIAAILVSLYR